MTAPRSTRRQKQAAATRQEILTAARHLFATKGYAATSMSAIAAEAETAVQTIYDSVGPKHAIILALVDVIEEEAGLAEYRDRLAATENPRELIALMVGLSRRFTERSGDVFRTMAAAAPTEPDVAAAWQWANQQHLGGSRFVATRLQAMGVLTPDLSLERATDVIAVLTWGTMWQQLTRDRGWSLDECESWMTSTIETLLLREPKR